MPLTEFNFYIQLFTTRFNIIKLIGNNFKTSASIEAIVMKVKPEEKKYKIQEMDGTKYNCYCSVNIDSIKMVSLKRAEFT